MTAVDAAFRRGQEQFDQGQYLSAARTWTAAAALLPETAEHTGNRAGIYKYITQAYRLALSAEPDQSELVEALTVLDNYANSFSLAHAGRTIAPEIEETRALLRTRLSELQLNRSAPPADAGPRPPPPATSAPPADAGPRTPPAASGPPADTGRAPPAPAGRPAGTPRPWKGLALGGGLALAGSAAMLLIAVTGATQVPALEAEYDSDCRPGDLSGRCGDIYRGGQAANRMQVAGLVGAAVLLSAGAAMVAVSVRRKSRQYTLAPALSPASAGATLRLEF